MKIRGRRHELTSVILVTYLPDCAAVLLCPEFSSLTGEIISNWMGVSGSTRASNESTERAGDGSEPTELILLARPARPLLEWREWDDGLTDEGLDWLFIISFGHLPAGSHALVSLLEGRRWCHSFKSWLVHSGCQLLPTGFLWLRYTTWPEFVDSSVNI